MSIQIAIRIPDHQLKELDAAVETGKFESRADAVRRALTGMLAELREREIAREYREAYTRHPQDPKIGEAGAILAAELYRREESQPE
jgi:Arc/MetJ-type ribon-helix-helix transcriptional regulator